MKRFWLIVFLLMSGTRGANADANSDAFNDASGFAQGNKHQGTSAASGTDPASVIPGYTPNPSQSSNYGGVRGGDGGIANQGQTALGQNEAGQATTDSSTKNPATKIDPNADFIQNGKNAEANGGSIVDGTNANCSDKVVSKSVFDNYSCDRDVNQIQTCARTGSVTGHPVSNITTRNTDITINGLPKDDSYADPDAIRVVAHPPAGTVTMATLRYTFRTDWVQGNPNDEFNLTIFGHELDMYDSSGSYTFAVNQTFNPGDELSVIIRNRNNSATIKDSNGISDPMTHATLTLTQQTGSTTYVSETRWDESCGFDKSTATGNAGTTCSDPGGTRSADIDGHTYTRTENCWQYTDSYIVPVNSTGNCGQLINNRNCTLSGRSCSQSEAGACMHENDTYQCQTVYQSEGLLCGGQYFCRTGDCSETDGAGDNGFDMSVSKLAGLASAGDDVKNGSQIDIRAFTGQAMSCRKAFAGFSNCCVDSGWGNNAGLAHCNSEEMAIGKAKAKKVTVYVGDKCDHAVLGVCVQKSQVYCVFGSKLSRIIQEQGRRDQLHIDFGSGDSPNCRGITVPELQSISFDRINFQDFYSDLMANQKIPNAAVMIQQAKDRVAAQVRAHQGDKK